MSTKIHALVDALGNPIGFLLTPGQAHDLAGADALLPLVVADIVIADKAFDADARVIEPLAAANKIAVIPPKSNRTTPRQYDKPGFSRCNPVSSVSVGTCAPRGNLECVDQR